MNWQTIISASDLPASWNSLAADNIFLKKDFLTHLEQVNSCRQSYHLLYQDNILRAIYVSYYLRLDILTFSRLQLKYPLHIMGIPCSVSRQGYAAQIGYSGECIRHFQETKGATLVLNSDAPPAASYGETLPTLRLDLQWNDFPSYLAALRSHYRYRWQKALAKWADVTVSLHALSEFSPGMYRLYEEVYKRSPYKLEKVSLSFFEKLPLPARLIVARYKEKLLGFAAVIENGRELIFLFCGFDYNNAAEFDTYHNLLLEILRYAAQHQFVSIDFGQTAEDTKLKLGCVLQRKYLCVHHSNNFANKVINKSVGTFSYEVPDLQYRVLREQP